MIRSSVGIVAGFVLSLAAMAPIANADNQSFLDAVRAAGLKGTLPGVSADESLLIAGKDACRLLSPSDAKMFGRHPNWVADMVWQANATLERVDAVNLVNAAIYHLCPGVNPFGRAG